MDATASAEIDRSSDEVWPVIGDFRGIRRWAPAVMSERVEETPDGLVRVLQMPPDGREVRELLWAEDRYSYTYKFIGDTPNARNYYSTTRVVPINASRSRIELHAEFDPAIGVSDDVALATMTKLLHGNLKAMKRALGV